MRNRKFAFFLFLFFFVQLNLVSAFEGFDATHLFDKEAKALALKEKKETKAEYELRTKGFVQNADVRPKQVGDIESFNCFNLVSMQSEKIPAVLKKIGKYCYVYLEQGKTLDDAVLSKIVFQFDNYIYPTTTSYFGTEWNPGIDGDPKITLFFLDIRDGFDPSTSHFNFTAGYFYPGDEYSKDKNPNSNEREMLYLDIYPSNPSRKDYMSVVAHEFQHMIHWHHDALENTWLNEGMSQLSSYLNGFGHPKQVLAYWRYSDNNLMAWQDPTMIANYGQVYLFGLYLYSQLGKDLPSKKTILKSIVADELTGSAGIEHAFKKNNIGISFQGLFSNFCVANYLNDPNFANGLYSYKKFLEKMKFSSMCFFQKPPFSGRGTVKPWSARAIRFNLSGMTGPIMVSFQGSHEEADDDTKSPNSYAVAAVLLDSNNSKPPILEWLNLKQHKAEQILKTQAGAYDTLQLIVTHRGPIGQSEMPFACSAPSASFA
ncbi:MAG: hypothetical protein HQM08_25830, partial [Candidatus Riflebacteria bacterium]|nr:hypothetical protein [Candidatus Riflebacteria bacterium]